MNLRLSSRQVEGVTIVDCSGRIVFGDESLALRDFVKGLLQESKKIIVNLREVNYIDSGGLGTLVGLYTSAHSVGGTIKLSNLTHRVGELLQVTKLVTVFEVFDNEQKAIQSFRKAAVVS